MKYPMLNLYFNKIKSWSKEVNPNLDYARFKLLASEMEEGLMMTLLSTIIICQPKKWVESISTFSLN